jgi:hypothetical protein
MKKNKLCAVVFHIIFFPVISLFLLLCLIACLEEPEEDTSIGEITIYNIPERIPVFGNETVSVPFFKIYLNASNTQSKDDPPAAKGVAKFSDGKLEKGTYTITIQLQNPNPPDKKDPNEDTGLWSGTANYFSLMICPEDVSGYGVDAVWVKGGTTLNRGKESLDWESKNLPDFRASMKLEDDPLGAAEKTQALYADIVCKDGDIKGVEK